MTVFRPARGERQAHVAPEDPDDQVWHGRQGRADIEKLVDQGKAPGDLEVPGRQRMRFEDYLTLAIVLPGIVALGIGVGIVIALVRGGR